MDITGENYEGKLIDFTIEGNCYVNDNIIGTTVTKTITANILNPGNNLNLENKEISAFVGIDEEVIPLGNFIIEKTTNKNVQNKTSFIGHDYMIKFNVPYIDNNTYPIDLNTFFSNLCNQVGLEVGSLELVNGDYLVLGNPFNNNENCRQVLSAIAQLSGGFATIGRDNKVYIITLERNETLEEIDGNNYDYSFQKNNIWGEVNTLVIRLSNIEGENSVRQDEESINAPTNKNICPNKWALGHYSTTGEFGTYQNRVCVEWLVPVKPYNNFYAETFNENYKFLIRTYLEDKTFSRSFGSVSTFGTNAEEYYIGISIYSDTDTTSDLLELIKDGTIKPFICLSSEVDKTYVPYAPFGEVEIVIEDNPFLKNEEEREKVIENLWAVLKGIKYLPFSTDYYGYPYLDVGDRIQILDENDISYETYVFNHKFSYNGAFKGNITTQALTKTQTAYKNITDAKTKFKQVERIVDKINGEIVDIIKTQKAHESELSIIETELVEQKITADGIINSVEETTKKLSNDYLTAEQINSEIDGTKDDIEILKQKQALTELTAEGLQIQINNINNEGINKVKTSTGYTFDENGLTIEKTDAKTKSILNETGLDIKDATGSKEESLLFAGYDEQTGETIVKSKNMTVEKYLVVGKYSRMEDFEDSDGKLGTGMFWIGG